MMPGALIYTMRVDQGEAFVPSYKSRCDYCTAEVWIDARMVHEGTGRYLPAICSPCLMALVTSQQKGALN